MNWIDVNVALPRYRGMLVWVYDPDNKEKPFWEAEWDDVNQSFSSDGGWFEVDEVTHWALRLPDQVLTVPHTAVS